MSGVLCVPLTIAGCFWPPGPVQKLLVMTGIACGIYAAFKVWSEENKRADDADKIALQLKADLDAQGQLEISFRENERQFDERPFKSHLWRTRQLSVCVENVGARALTNCQIYFDGISTDDGHYATGIAMRSNPFSLNASDKSFVLLASCEERNSSTPSVAVLHAPPTPNAFGEFRLISTSEPHEITLRATAAECEPCVRKFRVWFSADAGLQMLRL